MDEAEIRKYRVLEKTLQEVNTACVAINDSAKKYNCEILGHILNTIIFSLKQDEMFKELYQEISYNGSFYDNLKVKEPNEFDIDFVFTLPKSFQPKIEIRRDCPGYINVRDINNSNSTTNSDTLLKFYRQFMEGNILSSSKCLRWFQKIVDLYVRPQFGDFTGCISKGSPAFTLKLSNGNIKLDIDLVPSFLLSDIHWPQGFRKNTSLKRKNFLIVPKYKDQKSNWRLSFKQQEREFINDLGRFKPALRLLKLFRDTQGQHCVKSYFINTLFLWKLEQKDKDFWNKNLGYVFMTMLRAYSEMVSQKTCPYYWNKNFNLLGDMSQSCADNYGNCIRRCIKNIDDNLSNDPGYVRKCLMPRSPSILPIPVLLPPEESESSCTIKNTDKDITLADSESDLVDSKDNLGLLIDFSSPSYSSGDFSKLFSNMFNLLSSLKDEMVTCRNAINTIVLDRDTRISNLERKVDKLEREILLLKLNKPDAIDSLI